MVGAEATSTHVPGGASRVPAAEPAHGRRKRTTQWQRPASEAPQAAGEDEDTSGYVVEWQLLRDDGDTPQRPAEGSGGRQAAQWQESGVLPGLVD